MIYNAAYNVFNIGIKLRAITQLREATVGLCR
jgi:hypothetical protein